MSDTFDHFYSKFLYSNINGNGVNRTADCPFCERENKFSFDINNGIGRCLSAACDIRVNHISFLTRYHQSWLDLTTDAHYRELSDLRGPSVSIFKQCKLAYDGYNDRWLVPYKNPYSPHLSTLGHFSTYGSKAFLIYKPPNIQNKLPVPFYNPYQPIKRRKGRETPTTYRVSEGEWDLWALMTLAEETSADALNSAIWLSAPGAANFPDFCRKWFEPAKDVQLFYDNDEAGQSIGIPKASLILNSWGKKYEALVWEKFLESFNHDEDEPPNDVRDVLLITKSQYEDGLVEDYPKQVYNDLISSVGKVELSEDPNEPEELSAGYVASIADISEVPHFDQYVDDYAVKGQMHLNRHNRMALATTMAVATSQYIPGEPLWFFLVGQAGCGKTTLIESYGGQNEYFDYASRITAKNLVSGWQGGDEPSLVARMNGKTFFIKDFTVVLGMPMQDRTEVFNLFRDIYDGTLHITFGNGKVCNWHNLRFNLVAGVTDAIKKHNDASMGERFLRLDYMGPDANDKAIIESALTGFGKTSRRKEALTNASLGYVKTLFNNQWDVNRLPSISEHSRERIGALARYTALIRTRMEEDRKHGLAYRPRPEIASRLGLQYAKLAFALEKVFHPNQRYGSTIDFSDITLNHVAKVAYDTSEGFNHEIIGLLHSNPRLNRKQLSNRLKIPSTRLHKVIKELDQTGLIRTAIQPGGERDSQGRPPEFYYVEDDFKPIVELVSNCFQSSNGQ